MVMHPTIPGSPPLSEMPPRPLLDNAAIDTILRAIAGRLDAMNPGTIMSANTLHTEVQVAVWDWHGTYTDVIAGRDINTVLGMVRHLPLVGTRTEYSLRIRLMLAEVSV